MLYKKKVDLCLKLKSVDKLSAKLRRRIIICQENIYHSQKLQKQAQYKSVKPRTYVPSNKVWLNSKYIIIKRERKLEAKFFGPFQVLYLVEK